jgi:ABC transport system ATP-binding/permease protein
LSAIRPLDDRSVRRRAGGSRDPHHWRFVASLLDAGTGTAHHIPPGGIAIGRDPVCAIVLDARDISRRHARIVRVDGEYTIIDESTNGVFLNGERVSESHALLDGDVIRVADTVFRFALGDVSATAHVPATSERADDSPTIDAPTVTMPIPRRNAAEFRAAALLATLDVVEGNVPLGMRFHVERPVAQIGRGTASDICLLDATISGAHATLMLRGDTWYVLDHSSFNGTYVDGARVSQCALPNVCDLRLGGVTLRFRVVARQEQPSTSSTAAREPAR